MKYGLYAIALALASIVGLSAPARADAPFKKVMIIIFENQNYDATLQQPFFAQFANTGANLTNFHAEVHPSEGNYIAMIAGNTFGIHSDDQFDLNERSIVDLLEEHGKSWKVYAEAYPGNCFTGMNSGTYYRKHIPMMSFTNISTNPVRCANIVNADQLEQDMSSGNLPDYSLYIPDINNDGHDTGLEYANNWFSNAFGPKIQDSRFMQDMLIIAGFDESTLFGSQHIYFALNGAGVRPGAQSQTSYDHYSILRTIEDAFGLGTLGQNDDTATPITDIWQ